MGYPVNQRESGQTNKKYENIPLRKTGTVKIGSLLGTLRARESALEDPSPCDTISAEQVTESASSTMSPDDGRCSRFQNVSSSFLYSTSLKAYCSAIDRNAAGFASRLRTDARCTERESSIFNKLALDFLSRDVIAESILEADTGRCSAGGGANGICSSDRSTDCLLGTAFVTVRVGRAAVVCSWSLGIGE